MADSPRPRAFQPSNLLWKQLAHAATPCAFRAANAAQASQWQHRTRQALDALVGFQDLQRVPLRPRRIETVDRGDFIREKVILQTTQGLAMPVYILKPKEATGRLPVALAFHGHGYGVKDIVGLWEDGSERITAQGYHSDFAVQLCRRGFLVAAPEIVCFGERQSDFARLARQRSPVPGTCQHSAMLALHMGKSILGLKMFEGKRLVDYLETRPDADTTRLGAMGISGGGTHCFFSTCLDTRIKACVVSGYFCSFRESILDMHHCACNYVPGMHQFGEMHDLAGLIAPRPMLIESASHDYIFPRSAVRKGVARAREVYRRFGVRDGIETDYFEGRHQISGARAYDFLAEKLALP